MILNRLRSFLEKPFKPDKLLSKIEKVPGPAA